MERLRRWLQLGLLLMTLWLGLNAPIAIAAEAAPMPVASASELFSLHCVGCHPNGNNIVRRGKTLKLRALQRNHVDSVTAIADRITHGKGIMSAYGDRLTAAEIDLLAEYVWQQAQAGWPQS